MPAISSPFVVLVASALVLLLTGARPLFDLRYRDLERGERARVASQLREIVRRALSFYRETGSMPDLYGRTSTSSAERRRLNTPMMLPWRLWSFLVQRNLLRSHKNPLMMTTLFVSTQIYYSFRFVFATKKVSPSQD